MPKKHRHHRGSNPVQYYHSESSDVDSNGSEVVVDIEEIVGYIEICNEATSDLHYLIGVLTRAVTSACREAIERNERGFVTGKPGHTQRATQRLETDIQKLSNLQEVVPPHYSPQFINHIIWQAVKCIKQTAFIHNYYTDGLLSFCLRTCFDTVLGKNQFQLNKKDMADKLDNIFTDILMIDYESINQPLNSITDEDAALWTQYKKSSNNLENKKKTTKNLRKSAVRDTNRPRVMSHIGSRSRSPR